MSAVSVRETIGFKIVQHDAEKGFTVEEQSHATRKPQWLRKKINYTDEIHEVKSILGGLALHTVCKSARCPNLSECFHNKRATFLILGNTCTRSCRFCSIEKSRGAHLPPPDATEPERLVDAVRSLGLRYVVITSVTRDDLADGGARQFAETVKRLREYSVELKIEVLTPDFLGNRSAIDTVAQSGPDVFNHNVETVPRLYTKVRPDADYDRSLDFLSYLHAKYPSIYLKSGLMVGLGETREEIIQVLQDLRSAGCSAVTIGQYLQPGTENVPVVEYVSPALFTRYRHEAEKLGFSYIASGPYVRSSYMAHEGYERLKQYK